MLGGDKENVSHTHESNCFTSINNDNSKCSTKSSQHSTALDGSINTQSSYFEDTRAEIDYETTDTDSEILFANSSGIDHSTKQGFVEYKIGDEMSNYDQYGPKSIDPIVNTGTVIREPTPTGIRSILTGPSLSKPPKETKKVTNKRDLKFTDKAFFPETDASYNNSKLHKGSQEIENHDVLELEKRVYSNNLKSVSIGNLLSFPKKKSFLAVTNSGDSPFKSSFSQAEQIVIDDDIEEIESRIYGENVKKVAAKDMFKRFTAKSYSITKIPDRKSYVITLKINTRALAEVAKTENPFFTKGNVHLGSSFRNNRSTSAIPGFKVTLKISPDYLKKIDGKLTNNVGKKSATSLFQSMMKHSESKSRQSNVISKLKEFLPPILKRIQFHVTPLNYYNYKDVDISLYFSKKVKSNSAVENCQGKISDLLDNSSKESRTYDISFMFYSDVDWLRDYVMQKLPSKSPFRNTFYMFERNHNVSNDTNLWVDFLSPKSLSEVLVDSQIKNKIMEWLDLAFEKLKSQNIKSSRHALLKLAKKQKKSAGEFNDFIVDDSAGYHPDYSDVFVPLMIISGSVGSFKSTSIYAAMNDINGYVYEINTGHHRARKDIINTLREMSTTQLVHRNKGEGGFQKGIILLEDCDILFEQDRSFWNAVYEVLDITKRPIVLTCQDTRTIPLNIINLAEAGDSIIDLNSSASDVHQIYDFLWLHCIYRGFDLEKKLLNEILNSSYSEKRYDIRKALTECQFLCQKILCSEKNFIQKINLRSDITENEKQNITASLEETSTRLDLLSSGDLISTSSLSLIEHDVIQNEFTEIKYIDSSLRLKQSTLPFELNVGGFIEDRLNDGKYCSYENFDFLEVQKKVANFIGSRDIASDRGTQAHFTRSLRSSTLSASELSRSFDESLTERVGVGQDSICYTLSRTPHTLELSPYVRNWCHFQNSLDDLEIKTLAKNGVSIKKFIGWRQFYEDTNDMIKSFI